MKWTVKNKNKINNKNTDTRALLSVVSGGQLWCKKWNQHKVRYDIEVKLAAVILSPLFSFSKFIKITHRKKTGQVCKLQKRHSPVYPKCLFSFSWVNKKLIICREFMWRWGSKWLSNPKRRKIYPLYLTHSLRKNYRLHSKCSKLQVCGSFHQADVDLWLPEHHWLMRALQDHRLGQGEGNLFGMSFWHPVICNNLNKRKD